MRRERELTLHRNGTDAYAYRGYLIVTSYADMPKAWARKQCKLPEADTIAGRGWKGLAPTLISQVKNGVITSWEHAKRRLESTAKIYTEE